MLCYTMLCFAMLCYKNNAIINDNLRIILQIMMSLRTIEIDNSKS